MRTALLKSLLAPIVEMSDPYCVTKSFAETIVSSLLVDSPILFAVAGSERCAARLTSKLLGLSIRAACH
jgi:hypothetical protein